MKVTLSLIALMLPISAFSGWVDNSGKPIPDTPSMRSARDFGAQLILTSSDQEFRKVWNASIGTPKLQTTNHIKLGQSIAGVIVFSGCAPSPANTCNVTADFSVQNPDGTTTLAGNGPVWLKAAPKRRIIMLGDASITLGFGKDDSPGTYKLIANVTDKVTQQTLMLALPFTVSK